jgi:hypothetical protein
MSSQTNLLPVFKELADCYTRRGQAQMRDRFLVLAADAAQAAGQTDEAERLRLRLLQVNPHHLLKPYASFDQARAAPDVDTYIRNLRLNYPLEVAEGLLRALRASDDPATQRLQQTADLPARGYANEPTLSLEARDNRTSPPQAQEDAAHDGTLTLPEAAVPTEAARPAAAPRPRVPTKAEPAARPPAPRSTAPTALPPARPAVPTPSPARPRSASSKAPPRPSSGASPFAALPGDAAPAGRKSTAEDAPPDDNAWMASVLLVVVGLLGLGFAAFTLARPFLPKAWLP